MPHIAPRSMRDILLRSPVMPILTIHDAQTAGDLAQALVKGGVMVFEVVKRTPATIAALHAMCEAADPVAAFCADVPLWGPLAGDARLVEAIRRAFARVKQFEATHKPTTPSL